MGRTLIDIHWVEDQPDGTVYEYTVPGRCGVGRVLVSTSADDVLLLVAHPGEQERFWFQRVRLKLLLHRSAGRMPAALRWAC